MLALANPPLSGDKRHHEGSVIVELSVTTPDHRLHDMLLNSYRSRQDTALAARASLPSPNPSHADLPLQDCRLLTT